MHCNKSFTEYVRKLIATKSYKELRQLPCVAIHDPFDANWAEIYAWLAKEVGKDDCAGACAKFYFKYEKDAVLFALRWQ